MKKIHVKSQHGCYNIVIGRGLISKTGQLLKSLKLTGKAMIITQEEVARYYLKPLAQALQAQGIRSWVCRVESGETAKSPKELFRIFKALCDNGFERGDTMIALGGGVVGDLAGFAASAYLRGIPFINIATTLLAQVDSSIGGKTGINLEAGKNLVGAFYPPRLVVQDIQSLQTLPPREIQAALAEVIKYGVIRDASLFTFLENNAAKILSKHPVALEILVEASARIKAGVVSRDEHETKGERMILNFGHTFGHGFEKALRYRKLLHGEAVALGMVGAADLAVRLKLFPEADFKRLVKLLQLFHLPVLASGLEVNREDVLAAMSHDKKKRAGRLRFVLPTALGKVVVRDDVPERMIQDVLISLIAR